MYFPTGKYEILFRRLIEEQNLINRRRNPENLPVRVDQHVGLVPHLVVPVGAEQGDKLTSSLIEIF